MRCFMKMALIAMCVFAVAVGGSFATVNGQDGPAKVVIQEDKTEIAEQALALDPIIRVAYEYVGGMTFGVNCEGKRLTCAPGSGISTFKIDGLVSMPTGNL